MPLSEILFRFIRNFKNVETMAAFGVKLYHMTKLSCPHQLLLY